MFRMSRNPRRRRPASPTTACRRRPTCRSTCPTPAVDPRRAYTLPELVDIAESDNPVTRRRGSARARRRWRSASPSSPICRASAPRCSAAINTRRRATRASTSPRRRCRASTSRCPARWRRRVARDLGPGDRSRAGRHAAMAAVRLRRPRRGDRKRAAIVDRFRRRVQRRAPEADLRGRLRLLPAHRRARAGRDRDRDARQREVRLCGGAVARRARHRHDDRGRPGPAAGRAGCSSASSSRRASSATAITRC